MHLLRVIAHLNIDDFLSILDGSCQLRIDTLPDEDDFDHGVVDKMGPTHTREDVEALDREVGHKAKGEPISFRLGNQVLLGLVGDLRVGTSV